MNTPYHATTATPQDFSEPFSPGFVPGFVPECDDDEGGGHDRGDGGGAWGDSLQGPEVLEHGALPLGGSPQGGQQAVAGLLVGVGQGFFVGVWIAPGLMEAVMTGRITAMGLKEVLVGAARAGDSDGVGWRGPTRTGPGGRCAGSPRSWESTPRPCALGSGGPRSTGATGREPPPMRRGGSGSWRRRCAGRGRANAILRSASA